MRGKVVHLLVALLIAVFAIGAPQAAQADCATCDDCTTEAPAKNETRCLQKGLVCQIASSCASQVQKAPAQIAIQDDATSAVVFGYASSAVGKSAFVTPETAPPRR